MGTYYHTAEAMITVEGLKTDDFVWAFFHPSNKHDPYAIRIDSKQFYAQQTESTALGWVAKHQTPVLRKFIGQSTLFGGTADTAQAYYQGSIGIPMRVKRIKPGFSGGCIELYSNYDLLFQNIRQHG